MRANTLRRWRQSLRALARKISAAGTGARSAVVTRNELGGGLVVVSNGTLASQGVVTVRVLGWRRHQAW